MHSWLRFLSALLLLASAAVFLQARRGPEVLPPRQDLASFPMRIGDWTGRNTSLPSGVLDVLGPGEFLTRIYLRRLDEPYMDLFVAYFPNQRTGNTIHSPQNCLPGAGWTPIESGRFQLPGPGDDPIRVNRYVLAKGADRLLVLYWYQAHGRVVASEYWAKYYLVADGIRSNRTDGALLRIVTPLARGEDAASSQRRVVEFAQLVFPELDRYIPR